MDTSMYPQARVLDENDIHSILGRNTVGRLAFCWSGRADIRPLHYVYSSGKIYGRTSVGAKFAHSNAFAAPVAFEVDEIESVLKWKSVIAYGSFSILTGDGQDAGEWEAAVRLLRRVIKEAFGAEDPVPERDVVFRVVVQEVTGRASG